MFKIGERNDSRLASIKIALEATVWNGPMSLLLTMRPSIVGVVQTLGIGVITLGAWIVAQVAILYFGLRGMLTYSEDSQN